MRVVEAVGRAHEVDEEEEEAPSLRGVTLAAGLMSPHTTWIWTEAGAPGAL